MRFYGALASLVLEDALDVNDPNSEFLWQK
jgi:hypothetical protein